MMTEEAQIKELLLCAIRSGDENALAGYVSEVSSYCFQEPTEPDEFSYSLELFPFLLSLFEMPEFLGMKGSFHVLMLFESDWGLFSEDQKCELAETLERAYEKFVDWTSCFVISELFGEYFMNERALQALIRLRNVKPEHARALVPHGLEHIIKGPVDKDLATRAYKVLLQMRADPSEEVREEVRLSELRIASAIQARSLGG